MFHYTADSSKNMEETIESLKENLKNEQFGVQWIFNINEKLEAKGLTLPQKYQILEVCNPVEAHRVLTKNPLVSYFLPCKIIVFEENNQVKVGMPLPTALISMVEDQDLKEIAESIEKRLIHCIEQSL
ncbi:DUF302 domain-containing protein [Rummeliibacillus pycnus]|uniref:DUF302 domain-containing protein n=1 Tax=Rummeliibacillus pycnus TaxID=101070 RepID=UPI000C9C18EB|nr:DUF302 domain-containing protein [Rummeliibacillus pycnus]